MVVTTRQTVLGDSSGLWAVHGFGATVIGLAILRGGFLSDVLTALQKTWVAWSLVAFLAYLAIRSAMDTNVGEVYIRYLARDILPALAFGAIMFGSARPQKKLEAVSIGACVVLFAISLGILWTNLRSDLFLVRVPQDGRLFYQSYGTQITLLVTAMVVILATYAGPWANRRLAIWALATPAIVVAAFFASQMIGSNNASALLGLLGLGIGMAGLLYCRHDVRKVGIILVGGLMGAMIAAAVIGFAPPMRFLQFNEVALLHDEQTVSPLTHNVDARLAIIAEHGIGQFRASPIFGNLAADRIVTGSTGNYVHSIASVQVHLGIVGSVLLGSFLLMSLWRLYRGSGHPILRIAAPAILTMSLFTFFIWPPIWFLIGGLFSRQGRP